AHTPILASVAPGMRGRHTRIVIQRAWRATNSANPAMYFASTAFTDGSISAPASSKTFAASATCTRAPKYGSVPSVRSTGSHAACASPVAPRPGVAPLTPIALPPYTRGISADGRLVQSIAFLNTPGSELLYS